MSSRLHLKLQHLDFAFLVLSQKNQVVFAPLHANIVTLCQSPEDAFARIHWRNALEAN